MKKFKDRIRDWEDIQGYSSSYSISARMGKHYCPDCNGLLTVERISKVVNSESEEAKDFDFDGINEGRKIGNVEFTWDVYYCASCDVGFTLKHIIGLEDEKKKQIKEQKKLLKKQKKLEIEK